jgi:hypothetical protein
MDKFYRNYPYASYQTGTFQNQTHQEVTMSSLPNRRLVLAALLLVVLMFTALTTMAAPPVLAANCPNAIYIRPQYHDAGANPVVVVFANNGSRDAGASAVQGLASRLKVSPIEMASLGAACGS